MMKIQVSVVYRAAENVESKTYEIGVSRDDLVADVKEKMSAVARIAFAMTLLFEGLPMENGDYLADYDIEEDDELELIVDATCQTVLAQAADIVGSRLLSVDELGMFYAYHFGMSVSEALKSVGCKEKLVDILKESPGFVVEKTGRVRRGLGPLLKDIKPAAIWKEAAKEIDREEEERKSPRNSESGEPESPKMPLLSEIDTAKIWREAHLEIDEEEEDRARVLKGLGPAAGGLTKFWHANAVLDPWATSLGCGHERVNLVTPTVVTV